MDKIDQKLLKELDVNPRIPLSRLAKKIRVSQQVADYRLKRLLKQKVITKLSSIINLKALGLEHYRIFFTFNAKKEVETQQIFSYLREQNGLYWAARIGGRYDLLTVIFVQDFEAFDQFIDHFNNTFPGLIKDYKSCYGVRHTILGHKFFGTNTTTTSYGYNDRPVKIDALDKQIISSITNNCRRPALDMAKQMNVSYKTIINRIKRLEKKQVILGYRMFIQSLDYKPFIVLFSYREYTKEKEKKLLAYMSQKSQITQTVQLFGVWNLFAHARCKDYESTQELIIELRDHFNIIDDFEIIPVFEDIMINLYPK